MKVIYRSMGILWTLLFRLRQYLKQIISMNPAQIQDRMRGQWACIPSAEAGGALSLASSATIPSSPSSSWSWRGRPWRHRGRRRNHPRHLGYPAYNNYWWLIWFKGCTRTKAKRFYIHIFMTVGLLAYEIWMLLKLSSGLFNLKSLSVFCLFLVYYHIFHIQYQTEWAPEYCSRQPWAAASGSVLGQRPRAAASGRTLRGGAAPRGACAEG